MPNSMTSYPRIFVSHSHKENEFGFKLVRDLRRTIGNDNAVWYDVLGGLYGGDSWWQKILEELNASTIFIVILSPSAMQSSWVNDEIDIAWRLKNSPAKMRIIPLLYQPCKMRTDLDSIQIISFHSKTYEDAFNELLEALRLPTGRQIPSDSRQQQDQSLSEIPPTTTVQRNQASSISIPSSQVPPPVSPSPLLPLRRSRLIALLTVLVLIVMTVPVIYLLVTNANNSSSSHGSANSTQTPAPSHTAIPTASIIPASSPTLSDPLQDNSKGFQWQEVTNSDGSCQFVPGKHYLVTGVANQYIPCKTQAPQSNLGNFVYQITMTILSGLANTGSRASPVGAGPQFRIASSLNNPHYGILFNAQGYWSFYVVVNKNGNPLLTPLGGARCGEPCPYFKTGYNQPNVFTIWAVGSHFDVWLNEDLIDSISDTNVPSGFLGVRLNVGNSSSSVEFSDLRVWQL